MSKDNTNVAVVASHVIGATRASASPGGHVEIVQAEAQRTMPQTCCGIAERLPEGSHCESEQELAF